MILRRVGGAPAGEHDAQRECDKRYDNSRSSPQRSAVPSLFSRLRRGYEQLIMSLIRDSHAETASTCYDETHGGGAAKIVSYGPAQKPFRCRPNFVASVEEKNALRETEADSAPAGERLGPEVPKQPTSTISCGVDMDATQSGADVDEGFPYMRSNGELGESSLQPETDLEGQPIYGVELEDALGEEDWLDVSDVLLRDTQVAGPG